ncbi:hypothetical protein PoB_003498600 [Plakobranchus ocellatus]|uniref:Uncharacterized protein n=1 Tax=Plakobranchus ocellatus TaxID=259542 RepID=A0AAV4AJM1_9GAST|nr:hypothetical protein PoB_003498600 [Plakobranchus ocellatus]
MLILKTPGNEGINTLMSFCGALGEEEKGEWLGEQNSDPVKPGPAGKTGSASTRQPSAPQALEQVLRLEPYDQDRSICSRRGIVSGRLPHSLALTILPTPHLQSS